MTSTDVYDRGSRSHATGTVSGSYYTVAAGDSFYSIGLRFGLPWQEVTRANNLADNAVVQPGKRLLIPGLNPQPPVKPPVQPPVKPPVKPPTGQPRLGINSPAFGSTVYARSPLVVQGVGGNLRGNKVVVRVKDQAGSEVARSETSLTPPANGKSPSPTACPSTPTPTAPSKRNPPAAACACRSPSTSAKRPWVPPASCRPPSA